MKKIKRKDGYIYIRDEDEDCSVEDICFLASEWAWAKKLSSTHSQDPDSMRAFWETLFEKKKDPAYTIFTDFPQNIEESCMTKNSIAKRYSSEILEMLKKHKESCDNT